MITYELPAERPGLPLGATPGSLPIVSGRIMRELKYMTSPFIPELVDHRTYWDQLIGRGKLPVGIALTGDADTLVWSVDNPDLRLLRHPVGSTQQWPDAVFTLYTNVRNEQPYGRIRASYDHAHAAGRLWAFLKRNIRRSLILETLIPYATTRLNDDGIYYRLDVLHPASMA